MNLSLQNTRHFLKQAPSVLSCPALSYHLLRSQKAKGATDKLRFLVLFNSLGIPRETRSDYFVGGAGPLDTLQPILAPLADFKENLLVVTGCDLQSGLDQNLGSHTGGTAHGLTGAMMRNPEAASEARNLLISNGPSIDVAIGEHIGKINPYAHLQLNVGGVLGNDSMCASFGMDGYQRTRLRGPQAIYRNLFSNITSTPETQFDPSLPILNYLTSEISRLRGELNGASQKLVLEAFRDSTQQIAQQLQSITEITCEKGSMPTASGIDEEIRSTLNLVKNIFSCGLSRVVYLDIGGTSSRITHSWLNNLSDNGSAITHHNLSHERADSALRSMCLIRASYATMFAEFFTALKNTPDGGSDSIFDNTVVLWTTETSQAYDHTITDMPCVLIAGRNSMIKQGGHHIRADGRPINDLHASLKRTFQVPGATFGDPAYNRSPIDIFT